MTRTRTFSEVALCHLPDHEIRMILSDIKHAGMTLAYANDAGFFIWSNTRFVKDTHPVLSRILATMTTDYVLFDVDVEPDPELEIYDA